MEPPFEIRNIMIENDGRRRARTWEVGNVQANQNEREKHDTKKYEPARKGRMISGRLAPSTALS